MRDTQPPEQRAEQVTRVEALLTGMDPGDASDPVSWPGWAQLLPHLHAVDLAATNNRTLHDRACDAIWYLLRSGDTTTGQQLAHHLPGLDHPPRPRKPTREAGTNQWTIGPWCTVMLGARRGTLGGSHLMGSARRRNPRCSHVRDPASDAEATVRRLALAAPPVPMRTRRTPGNWECWLTNHPTCWSESSQVRPQVEY